MNYKHESDVPAISVPNSGVVGSGNDVDTDARDVGALLDASPVRRGHVITVALLFLILVIDGYDLAVTGAILPQIALSLGVATASLTGAFAAQPIGQAVGGLLLSPLVDRFGRKRMLLIMLTGFALATLTSVFATSVTSFAVTRFAAGMLAGGLLPAAGSLVADISTLKRRSAMVGIVYAGIGVGTVGASVLVALLFNDVGWQGMYVIGALVPLLMIVPLILFLPESPLHLARKAAPPSQILAALRKLSFKLDPDTMFKRPVQLRKPRVSVLEIFADHRGLFTLILWFTCVCGQLGVNMFGLGATFFNEFEGIALTDFAVYASIAGLATLAAAFSTGFVMDRFGRYQIIALYALLDAVSLVGMGFFPFGSALFIAAIIGAGFFGVGTYQALNITTPIVYPAALRSVAVGWKGSVSRLGSSAAPLIGAALMANFLGLKVAMLAAAAPMLLVVLMAPVLAVLERRMRAYGDASRR